MKDIFFAPIRYRRDSIKAELLSIFVHEIVHEAERFLLTALRCIDKAASLGSPKTENRVISINGDHPEINGIIDIYIGDTAKKKIITIRDLILVYCEQHCYREYSISRF